MLSSWLAFFLALVIIVFGGYFAIMILHFDMESALWIEYFQVNHAIANQTIFAAIKQTTLLVDV